MKCIFSEPVVVVKTGDVITFEYPSATNQNFQWQQMTCNEDKEFLIQNPTNPTGNFIIQKQYTYGDITTILALGLIALFVIFYVLKRIFTHDEVSIHSYQTKF